ncbi:DUF4240 domain-containing protein [Streptomyces sp. NPDC006553]|uniref:DUF4240 domain-containing protein n=1 Tax=unclassified Streptomyces TaxID=2593676 RepID=UPI002252C795|nr:DUF4240 domain-containing protein [Streptomyces sp. NBC_00233]MCX5228645.1 DUF4240 domain-containing protein [Streptomyces sp. NBC_00233]
MNEDAFWALIDELSRRTGDLDERTEWLRTELLRRPAAEIVEFQVRLDDACEVAGTRALWRAANRIESGACTDDGFHYFTLWLVGQGRKVYDSVVADPDALADAPGIRALVGRHRDEWDDDEWPEWEELDYVAQDAYDELTGQQNDHGEEFDDAVDERAEELVDELSDPEEWEEGDEPRGSRPEGVAMPRLVSLFPLGTSGS